MKARLQEMLALYGRVGIYVYAALMVLTFGASYLLLRAGLQEMLPDAVRAWLPENATTLIGTYALYKGLQPPRIALALVLTPIVARWLGRVPSGPPPEAA